jgi:hypothetical protein
MEGRVEHSIQLSDFGRDEAEEVVLLSRNRREVPPWWSQTRERKLYREPIDYADTPETRKFRDAVRRLNALLSDADIEFLDEGLAPRIDPFDRTLRRRFTILPEQDVRFDQGGRLFGGFWQTLKSHRRRHIRINGEPVVVLDYASMFTRLAYAHLGARPPELDDLYAIPGLEGYRKGVKKAMNCFLFDNGPRRSWPSEFSRADDDDHHDDGNDHHDDGAGDHHHQDHEDAAAADGATDGSRRRRGGELRRASTAPLLPTGWGVGRTKKAVLAVHPALKNAWGCRLGYRLMFTESEVLIAVLRQLASLHIPALGLHDGLMVAVSCKDVAEKVMEEVAKEVAGIPLPVSVKGPL